MYVGTEGGRVASAIEVGEKASTRRPIQIVAFRPDSRKWKLFRFE